MVQHAYAVIKMASRVMTLEAITWADEQLHIVADVDGVKHTMDVWYNFDLGLLDKEYGAQYMERVYFHIAAVHLFKLTALKPTHIRFPGKYSKYDTVKFRSFWKDVFQNFLSQWRYENNMPNWKGPEFPQTDASLDSPTPLAIKDPWVKNKTEENSLVNTLVFVSGGKDSLLAAKLVERANIPYSTFSFNTSFYGSPKTQEKRVSEVLKHCSCSQSHKVVIFDPFQCVPEGGWIEKTGTITRTSSQLIEGLSICLTALPTMLHYGYCNAVVANERSANVGNLKWASEGGREVNHQYMKGYQAETMLNQYIRDTLISNYCYYSILQPIYDLVVFGLLRQYTDVLVCTHSCNFNPPWCNRCPKCCYIWVHLQAYMPSDIINPMFENKNLLDAEENFQLFKELLGLENHKPFECIGEANEVRLAFELCYRKGLKGKAMDVFVSEIRDRGLSLRPLVEKYTRVYEDEHCIPKEVADCVLPLFKETAAAMQEVVLGNC